MQMLRIFYCIFYGCVNCRFCCTLMRVYIWSLHRTPRLCRLLFVPPFCCPVQCQKGMNVNESRWNTKKPLRCGSRIDAGNGNNNYNLGVDWIPRPKRRPRIEVCLQHRFPVQRDLRRRQTIRGNFQEFTVREPDGWRSQGRAAKQDEHSQRREGAGTCNRRRAGAGTRNQRREGARAHNRRKERAGTRNRRGEGARARNRWREGAGRRNRRREGARAHSRRKERAATRNRRGEGARARNRWREGARGRNRRREGATARNRRREGAGTRHRRREGVRAHNRRREGARTTEQAAEG